MQYPNDPFLRHTFFLKRNEYKKLIKTINRKFHNSLLDRIQNLSDKNPSEFWRLVHSIKKNKATNKSEISPTEWHNYFENLNQFNDQECKDDHEVQIVNDYNIWAVNRNETLDRPISQEEICSSLKKLKNRKASSTDSLSNEVIKVAVKALSSYFIKIFNMFSSEWFRQNGLKALSFLYINQAVLMTLVM